MAQAAASAPLGEQKRYYKEYAEIIARDLPQLQLVNRQALQVVSTRFKGLEEQFNIAFNTFPNWAEAWLPKKEQ